VGQQYDQLPGIARAMALHVTADVVEQRFGGRFLGWLGRQGWQHVTRIVRGKYVRFLEKGGKRLTVAECQHAHLNYRGKINTPSTRLQQWAQQGGYVDPRTNQWVKTEERLQADHVYPKDLIKKLPGFDKLTREQQEWLLNYPGNFEPLPRSWNASKWNRLADDWAKNTPMGKQASNEYIDQLRERQEAFEAFAKEMVRFFLDD
jgi:hypothetical protein